MCKKVKIERQFEVNSEILWKALTDKDEMKKWYFEVENFIPEVGFKFQFWGESETRKYLHFCTITVVEDRKRICYSWEYDGIPGTTLVCFEITPVSLNSSELLIVHSGFETFPPEYEELSVESFEKGWSGILDTSLKNYLTQKKQ